MKKILLTTIYPFWVFFYKTIIGNVLLVTLCLSPIFVLISIICPELLDATGEKAKSMAAVVCVLSLLVAPFIGVGFITLGCHLESNYEKWGYKTQINNEEI